MTIFANLLCFGGIAQCGLALLVTFRVGLDCLTKPEDWKSHLLGAGLLLGGHAFGLLCYEFGMVLRWNRLRVAANRVVPWFVCRVFLFWLLAAFIPLLLIAGNQSYSGNAAAIPASLAAIGCLLAIVFLRRKIGHLERLILPGHINQQKGAPEGRISPDRAP